MKNIAILALVVLVLGSLYFSIKTDKVSLGDSAVYSNSELGFEFDYRSGPQGYVVEELTPSDASGSLVRTLVLIPSEDKKIIDEGGAPVGGEGPATITIMVLKNSKKEFPLSWAMSNNIYSNLNLKREEPKEVVVGGANAIRYMADGLYASDNVVVAHGENVYVFSGMFLDEASQLRKDFSPLIESVRFIP